MLGYALGLLLTLLLVQKVVRRFGLSNETGRKIVHVLSGAAVLTTPLFFHSATPLIVLSLLYVGINAWSIRTGAFSAVNAVDRPSLGTILYPLAFALLLLLFWDRYTLVWTTAFAIMAFADAAAGIAGQKAGPKSKMPLPWDKKTWRGTATMLMTSTAITAAGLLVFSGEHDLTLLQAAGLAVSIGVVSAAAEALSWRGSDNLSVPFFSALLLFTGVYLDQAMSLIYGTGLALLVGIAAYRAQALDLSGSLAAFLSGTLIFGLGGWVYSVQVLVFFITSSLLSHLPFEKKNGQHGGKSSGARRTAVQVISNGGIATLMVPIALFWPHPMVFLIYLSALAAATADTWATEIGQRYGRTPRSIITGEFVTERASGGVTPIGLSAALLGAGAVAFVGILTYNLTFDEQLSLRAIFFVIVAGYIGQLIDSLLGATLQFRGRCPVCAEDVEVREHCGRSTERVDGLPWLGNDAINLLCTLSGALFPLAMRFGLGIQL